MCPTALSFVQICLYIVLFCLVLPNNTYDIKNNDSKGNSNSQKLSKELTACEKVKDADGLLF